MWRHRLVHGALVGFVEAGILHFAHDADDGRPRARRAPALPDAASDGAAVREEAPRPGAIDDDGENVRRLGVALLEQAPVEQWQTEDAEVVGAHRNPRRDRLRLPRRRRRVLEIEVVEVVDVVRRTAVGERDPGDAGNRGDAPVQILPERGHPSGVGVLRRGQQDEAGDDVARVEAQVDAPQLIEAHHEQRRDDEQRRRNGELRRHEHAAQAAHGDAAGRRTSLRPQRAVDRRHEPEQHDARRREERQQPQRS